MSEIPKQFIHEARELLAAECKPNVAREYRRGGYDNFSAVRALARVLYERPQPTFEQRVEAMRLTTGCLRPEAERTLILFDRHTAEIMRPKVDPLVDAIKACGYVTLDAIEPEFAADLRKALAARGLEIVAKDLT